MNLLVFLSNRCNMTCDYCFLDLNGHASAVLDEKAALRALDAHVAKFAGARRVHVTLIGGEPFIHWDLLMSLARRLHAHAGRGVSASVVTNGTLATPERMRALAALGVGVTVSLDGDAAANDAHRALIGGGGPALGRILEKLGGELSGADANFTVCEDTAPALVRGFEALRKAGFRKLKLHLKIQERWTPGGLAALGVALDGLGRWWRAAGKGLELGNLGSLRPAGPNPHCDSPDPAYQDLVLGADGRFYPCYSVFAEPFSALGEWAVGDLDGGVDWKRRERLHEEARAFIHARLSRARHYRCPREAYFLARAAGEDPAGLVRSFHEADNLLGDALSRLLAPAGAP
ncbi:MAG: radical SAM protein [Elusimicrobiota bacterium]|nr:MAG: radical SAM protein [Elusimicrobiota bacterium]